MNKAWSSIRTVVFVLAIFLLFWALNQFKLQVLTDYYDRTGTTPSSYAALGITLAFAGVSVLLATVVYFLLGFRKHAQWKELFHRGFLLKLFGGVGSGLACYLAFVAAVLFLEPQFRVYLFEFEGLWQQLLVLVLTQFAVALSEEWVFRGYLLQALRGRVPMIVTVLLVSAVFALTHPVDSLGQWSVVVHFLLGVVLSLLVLVRKSIWASVGFHWLWNVGTAFLLQSDSRPPLLVLPDSAESYVAIIASFAVFLFLALLLGFRKSASAA